MEIVVNPGTRVGWWRPKFECVGFWVGDPLPQNIPGQKLEQNLMEGVLRFRIGVLFRPDLGKRHRLETILILENYFEEMWDYDCWSQE